MASTAWVFAILHKVCVVHQMHTAAAANLTQREHSRCQPRFLDPQRSDYCCPVLSASMDGRCCLSNSASAISVESSPFAELHETQRPVQELLSLRVDLEQLGKGQEDSSRGRVIKGIPPHTESFYLVWWSSAQKQPGNARCQ